MEKHSLNCPNCGSNDITLISAYMCVCNSCGSKFSISDESNRNIYVTNNILSENTEKPILNNYATINTMDTIVFTRRAAIALAETKSSPADIFESDFKPARVDKEQFFSASYKIDVSYSAAIGYNRAVNETYYNNNTKRYEVRTINIADWQPISGIKNLTTTGVVTLKSSGDCNYQANRFANIVLNDNLFVPLEDGKFIEDPILPSESNYAETQKIAENIAYNNTKTSLPGEYIKDYSTTMVTKLSNAKVTVVPDNVLPFEYKNSAYEIRGFSCTNDICAKTLPSTDGFFESYVKKPLKNFYIALAVIYALFISTIIVLTRLTNTTEFFQFCFLLPMLILSVLLPCIKFPIVKINTDRAYSIFAKNKIMGLEQFLKQNNLSPLNDDERLSIYQKNNSHRVTYKNFKLPILLFLEGVATIIYIIILFFQQ